MSRSKFEFTLKQFWERCMEPVCRSIERKVNEAIEPRKGHWIEHIERDDWNDYEEHYLECSQCHYTAAEQAFNYCPNCGAKMEG